MYILGPIYYSDRELCLYPIFTEDFEHLDTSSDTENAIIPATARLRIEMRASESSRSLSSSGANGKDVSHGIDSGVAAERLSGCYEPVSDFFVGIGKREARHSYLSWGAMKVIRTYLIAKKKIVGSFGCNSCA